MRDEQEAETALELGRSPQALAGDRQHQVRQPRDRAAAPQDRGARARHRILRRGARLGRGQHARRRGGDAARRLRERCARATTSCAWSSRRATSSGPSAFAAWLCGAISTPASARSPARRADVLILDTIGELAACYELATLVFVGGSFVERGGQNILEPAARGKPVLFGPHMENFADSVQVLLGRGGMQVASPEQLQRVMADLLARPEYRAELGAMAATQVSRVRGAAARNAELIAGLVEPAGSVAQPIGHGYSSPEESCEQRH